MPDGAVGVDKDAAAACRGRRRCLPEIALITEMIRRALRDEFACGAHIV